MEDLSLKEYADDANVIRQRVGKKLAELRIQKGLSVRQLSDISGIGASHICKIENGKHAAGLDILDRMCQALGAEIMIVEKKG